MPPAEQARVFLAMALSGAGLGGVYDGLCLAHRTLLRGRMARGIMDLLFGILCAAGVIATALYLRTDAFRWYTLLGTLAGMGMYRSSAGVLLRRLGACARRQREKFRQNRTKKGNYSRKMRNEEEC